MKCFLGISAIGLHLNLDPMKQVLNQQNVEYELIPKENYHITLNYLGNIEPEQLPAISQVLKEVAKEHDPFSLRLIGFSAFPTERESKYVWVGVQNSLVLRSLHGNCERRLNEIGLNIEVKGYNPHLTVAQLNRAKDLSEALRTVKHHELCDISVEKVELYESNFDGSIPTYISLAEYYLG